nr:11635_t:CDS:2 [Entrophospora candida]
MNQIQVQNQIYKCNLCQHDYKEYNNPSIFKWYRCVFKGMVGKENLNECLGSEEWVIKYYENNEAVFSDICTRSEDEGDVVFMWKEIEIVDSRENKTISNKLTVKLCINRSTLVLGENNKNL